MWYVRTPTTTSLRPRGPVLRWGRLHAARECLYNRTLRTAPGWVRAREASLARARRPHPAQAAGPVIPICSSTGSWRQQREGRFNGGVPSGREGRVPRTLPKSCSPRAPELNQLVVHLGQPRPDVGPKRPSLFDVRPKPGSRRSSSVGQLCGNVWAAAAGAWTGGGSLSGTPGEQMFGNVRVISSSLPLPLGVKHWSLILFQPDRSRNC